MFTSTPSDSLAGTWGAEKRSAKPVNLNYTTTFTDSYDAQKFSKEKAESANRFVKFRTMKHSGSAIMDSQKSQKSKPADVVEETTSFDNSSTLCGKTSSSTLKLQKTTSCLLTLPNAPVAVGRSGVRLEQGVSTSGLLGERLMLSDDPQYNSFVQRTWRYSDDPSLFYRHNGVPTYKPPDDDLRHAIGEELRGLTFKGW
eukprot:CAMPEP_0173182346 /NCGR_PEP_ID=MMETSP1141-20130122/7785_1 /TAXON_ID=483371 /ORGANISM="non described non described, Strain CCMP2298" /LENGTH=198 /DNA_ID=CAMNT_0014105427 /DNA_START=116 /DNA_END=709 /DNA_ORIENTATION=-